MTMLWPVNTSLLKPHCKKTKEKEEKKKNLVLNESGEGIILG